MSNTNVTSTTREVFVPREIIYDLWTAAEHLQQWYPPSSSTNVRASVDPRSGGTYRICWDDEQGNAVIHSGTFTELVAPQRLIYARTEGGDDNTSSEVRVELEDMGGTTRITVEQSGPANAGTSQPRADSWNLALDRLTAYLSVI